jgi:penicillin-binding protein 2
MEEYLKGKDGSRQIEVDVNGTLINTINEIDPVPGDTVFLTH